MKQTALNWLILNISYTTSQGEVISYQKDITRFVELAKQMEKEQVIKVFVDVSREVWKGLGRKLTLQDIIDFQKIAEVYYNEEFKSK